MGQMQTWIFYLIIGVNLLFSCQPGETEYVVKADFIYINNSQKTIILKDAVDDGDLIYDIKINPKETKKFILRGSGGDISKDDVNDCCQYFLESIHDGEIFLKADSLCIYYRHRGAHDIKNYEGKRLSDRHLEYTYYFTDENLQEAKDCEEAKQELIDDGNLWYGTDIFK